MTLHKLLRLYLKDSGEVSIHWSFCKLWCYTVVHFDLMDAKRLSVDMDLTTHVLYLLQLAKL